MEDRLEKYINHEVIKFIAAIDANCYCYRYICMSYFKFFIILCTDSQHL